MAVPMVNSIILSFQSWNGMSPPVWAGLKNYRALFGDRLFLIALGNTAYFTIATVILQSTIPLLVASMLDSRILGGAIFRTLYFMPVIISLAISGLLWAMIYEPNFGVLNEFLRSIGLGSFTQLWLADRSTVMPSIIAVSVWQSLGFYLVIYYAAMQNIPRELYEAARIDNANALQRLWHVTVPMLRPVIVLVIVLNTIHGIKVFDQIWVMTAGGPNHASDTLGTYLYSTSFGAMGSSNPQLGYATAIAIVILVLSFLLSILQIRLGKRREIEY
jgi:ABC-type sugar transport system permease subunit